MTHPTASAAPRLGPRPLPLHLMLAGLTWASSQSALPLWKSGSIAWKDGLQENADALAQRLQNALAERAKTDGEEGFEQALAREVKRRLEQLALGIERYRHHPYRRSLPEPRLVWSEGTTRLLDYGGEGPPVLFVPSLINRAYILDLTEEISLLRWLAGQGLRPYLLDWDRPGDIERSFSLTDYICGRLESALHALRKEAKTPPLLAG